MPMQETSPGIRRYAPDPDHGARLDHAIRVITGLPADQQIRANGVQFYPIDTIEDPIMAITLQIVKVGAHGPIEWEQRFRLTAVQYQYLREALTSPDRVQAVGDIPVWSHKQVESIINAREAVMTSTTIRVKVVAGRLVLMPKDGHGWLFECSAWEGSKITYGGRTYTYTDGQLIEDTEEVTGE